jgi:lysophospholipase
MQAKLTVVLYALILAMPGTALAINEANYAAVMKSDVLPFFAPLPNAGVNSVGATIQPGIMVSNIDQKKIAYLYVGRPNARATIVVVNGMSENYLVYREVIYDLYQAGYSVFTYDHRGQGQSDRLDGMDSPPARRQITHVDHFTDYVSDLKQIVTEVVEPLVGTQPKFLIGHSMGGGISAIYLADPRNASHFRAAALTSPMLEIITDVFTTIPVVRDLDLTKLVPALDNLVSLGGVTVRDIFGHEKELAKPSNWCSTLSTDITKATDPLTSSPARYAMKVQLYLDHPDICINGPSNQWVDQVLQTMLIVKSMPFLKINIPIVMFQAGRDSLVLPEYQENYCRRDANCHLVPIADAQHEILLERDGIRNDIALPNIYKLFNSVQTSTR